MEKAALFILLVAASAQADDNTKYTKLSLSGRLDPSYKIGASIDYAPESILTGGDAIPILCGIGQSSWPKIKTDLATNMNGQYQLEMNLNLGGICKYQVEQVTLWISKTDQSSQEAIDEPTESFTLDRVFEDPEIKLSEIKTVHCHLDPASDANILRCSRPQGGETGDGFSSNNFQLLPSDKQAQIDVVIDP